MNETGKASLRRSSDYRYSAYWITGTGIDIGSGDDPLLSYKYLYPNITSCMSWDLQDGDAQLMVGCPDNFFNFVHSSHCLEHMRDPRQALINWIRICKPGGHLVLTFPDEDLYEQGQWPSVRNSDHKHTFTISKNQSWSPVSINVFDLLKNLSNIVKPVKIELIDSFYDYFITDGRDQTLHGNSECAIEIVLRKNNI